MTMSKELIPQDRPADVVSVEELNATRRDGIEGGFIGRHTHGGPVATERSNATGEDIRATRSGNEGSGFGARLADPINAQAAEAERQRLATPFGRNSASALLFQPADERWVPAVSPVTSHTDGAFVARDTAALLSQTVRVDTDGNAVYGVKVGAHDLRIKRVFVR